MHVCSICDNLGALIIVILLKYKIRTSGVNMLIDIQIQNTKNSFLYNTVLLQHNVGPAATGGSTYDVFVVEIVIGL